MKLILSGITLLVLSATTLHAQQVELFNGKDFSGWNGNDSVFRVENNTIIGGSFNTPLEESYYMCTDKKYSDFELTLSVKMFDEDSICNAGISFRASRVPESNEVAAYQADVGFAPPDAVMNYSVNYTPENMDNPFTIWGCLVDECREDVTRYPKPDWFPVIFLEIPDREIIRKAIKPHDWNEIKIIASGNNIIIKINDITTVNYNETSDITTDGFICLQAHSGEPHEVHYKNIILIEK